MRLFTYLYLHMIKSFPELMGFKNEINPRENVDILICCRMMSGCDSEGPIIPGGTLTEKPLPPVTPGDPPDIQTFLNSNKDRVDADPEANPYDDLRHYAYEGDGNSGGSLSSLNSGEDDADLEFEYLHKFGPRFKKLADMYGRESDSESEQEVSILVGWANFTETTGRLKKLQ